MGNYIDNNFFKVNEIYVDEYVNSLGDIEKYSSLELLDKFRVLSIENRKKLFSNEFIRNKLRVGLLKESSDNQWFYYREILKKITVSEFLSLYDYSFLHNYFVHTERGEEIYKFYASLCECNVSAVVKYVLSDKELYEDFFRQSSGFYPFFSKLSYDEIKEIILKMQNDGYELSNYFLNGITEENGIALINDVDINDDTLVFVLPMLGNKVKSDFFENNSRALYLYNRFNIDGLIDKGIVFNDNILKKKDFFDLLKKDSFVEFRTLINKMEKHNNPVIIEGRLEEYYEEIVDSYDKANDMFKDYFVIFENPGKYLVDNSYIFDFDVAYKIGYHKKQSSGGEYFYFEKEKLLEFLRDATNKKLSEVIIDALFKDNIYNVWLNIKEMIRYNEILDVNDKVLDSEKIAFYEMILNFDRLDNSKKIKLYHELKNNNFSFLFYNDLRRTKDKAYDKIKEKLINPYLHSEYINPEFSKAYDVEIYDLRDKEYNMLVRTQDTYRDVVHYMRGCYSIISNENTQIFGEYATDSFLYGYNSFENDEVIHMFESDSYSTNFRDEHCRYVNRIMTAEQLVKANSSYNEIQLINKKNTDSKHKWNAKKPDFLVVFDFVGDKHVKESKRLNIPIVVISKRTLDKKDVIDVHLINEPNTYAKSFLDESEQGMKR